MLWYVVGWKLEFRRLSKRSVESLRGKALPERSAPVVATLRASGFFLEEVWLPLRDALPDHSPTDILREALVARFALEVRDSSGGRPRIEAFIGEQRVEVAEYLGIDTAHATRPSFASLKNKARREPEASQNLSVRINGEFLTSIWNPLRDALPALSSGEILKQALTLRAALEATGPDGEPLKIIVSFIDDQGKPKTEDLAVHIGLPKTERRPS